MVSGVVALDQWTKFLSIQHLPYGQPVIAIENILNFTLIDNAGIAFGFFDRHPKVLLVLIFISLLILASVAWSLFKQKTLDARAMDFWGLVLIVGGAVGNLIDRFRHGAVIDFIDLDFWPLQDFAIFNIADSAISFGIGIYLFSVYFGKSQHPQLRKVR